ncbi:UNVERIFIED_CONTAM: E3 ubiquitin-protein ligase SDIR1 [Sesamum angustifolium]|uniref:RING-type E3 ubiquitin transferase n=1 Tax=Sesamum angustifolium TaxID=2727405 RepID=A0AAW2PUZ2_9LAMI
MSFVFRGTRGDIETGFPGLIPERRAVQSSQAHAVAASGLLGHTELRLHMPPSIALATRGRLQGLRLQLALLDREFDDLDYETLRALDADNVPTASMSEEESMLPVQV